MKDRIFILIFVAVVFVVGVLFYLYNPNPIEYSDPNKNVVCTMEALLCPDGSYVSRVPPDCRFEACPAPPPDAIFEDGTIENSDLPTLQ